VHGSAEAAFEELSQGKQCTWLSEVQEERGLHTRVPHSLLSYAALEMVLKA
jgi:hypothetical protein